MAFLLRRAFTIYEYCMEELSDPRLNGWFLMDSLLPTLLITLAYPYLVWVIGPNLMKNKKSFNIDRLLTLYNIVQVIANIYVVINISKVVLKKFNLYCNVVDYSNDEDALILLRAFYIYFILKIVDLSDTVFFILRKKFNQITFLHVYHHAVMVPCAWLFVRFIGGGHTFFIPLINSFVHACMYVYYLITVWNKKYKNNSWLKRRITEIQLIQFLTELIIQTIAIPVQCQYPKTIFYMLYPQTIFFLILFADFYVKTYLLRGESVVEMNEKRK